jgi:hypothetical protein
MLDLSLIGSRVLSRNLKRIDLFYFHLSEPFFLQMSLVGSGIGNKWSLSILSLSCRSCEFQITVFDDVFHVFACCFVWLGVETLSEVCSCKTSFSFKICLSSLSTYFHVFGFFLMLQNLQFA